MNILVISSYLPYPLYSGGHIRLYNLLKRLSKKHTITLVCEKRTYQETKDIEEVKKICTSVITVERKKQWSMENIMKTGLSTQPFLIIGHTNKDLQQVIRYVLDNQQVDLIHVETSYVMQNIPETKVPIFLVEHNIEYLVYQRFAVKAPVVLRSVLSVDVHKLKKSEEQLWKRATMIGAVSEQEKEIIEKVNSHAVVVPNGVDIEKFQMKDVEKSWQKKEKRLLFIGDFKWIQNRDAATFLLKKVWPLMKENSKKEIRNSNIKFWIVGKNIPEDIKKLGDTDVIFDEHADDTAKVFRQADILLALIRVGGGTSYKILESMASGTPVITTTLGWEGIKAKKDDDIVVVDTKEAIVQQVNELLSDKKKYFSLAENGRNVIETYYNWDKIAEDLDKVYTLLIDK